MREAELSERAVQAGLCTRFIGRVARYYPVLASTQEAAKEAARAGVPEGAVFLADEQRAGRGRMGRRWLAPAGSSILLSVLFRPTMEVYPKLFMVASLAAALAIEETTGLRTDLKWPNDVLLRDKKVSGVLVEGEFAGEKLDFAVLGIGVNVNLDPTALTDPTDQVGLLYPATSLSHEVGASVSRLTLAQSLLRHLERLYLRAAAGEAVHELWRARLVTLGKGAQVRSGDETVVGLAEDVDADGCLLLRREDGSLATFVAGDVTLQA